VVCRKLGYGKAPAEYISIHHLRAEMGMGMRNDDTKAIPLCGPHHQTGGFQYSIHEGQETWESNYGTEEELLELTLYYLELDAQNRVN